MKLVIAGTAMFATLGLIAGLSGMYSLNIKAKTVGHGQHGTARWATKGEIKKTYVHVPFEPELWRKGEHLPTEQGIVVGCLTKRHRVGTATGNQNWSTEAIQRILQNEKYMGDVLLQKTYTADFIEGKVKKNNGELPQYYIKDNHPAIIPREMFYQIQEEIARRKSKKPANTKKAKTNRGRFTSKYALSERLVCGNCGCYFRRVTWSIHGRKQIVWRCINRLECGPKACKDSPSLKEDELYSAILKAIRSLVQGHQEEMASTLQEALIHCIGGENAAINPLVIENRLHELDKDLDRLLTMDGSEIVDLRIKQISDEMLQLRQMKKRAELDAQQDMGRKSKAMEIMDFISAEDLDLTEYSDTLVYRVIERVTVLSKEEIRIRFIGGFEITQPLH